MWSESKFSEVVFQKEFNLFLLNSAIQFLIEDHLMFLDYQQKFLYSIIFSKINTL